MLKTTTDVLQGYNIVKYCGMIMIYQEFKDGKLEIAFQELELKANEMGGNAIIGIRFEPFIQSEVLREASYSAGRVIYGTVVKVDNTVEEIYKYKQLFDSGIISEEEYNSVKNKIIK